MSLMLALNQTETAIDLTSRQRKPLTWLQNAVTVSLFTDARASADEVEPGEPQRGYWGDRFLPEGQSLGSKLWLLRREKLTPHTLNRARNYAQAALDWLVDDGFMRGVEVATRRIGNERIEIAIRVKQYGGEPDATFFMEYQLEASNAV